MSTLYKLEETDLDTLLEQALRQGEIQVQRKDGRTFAIRPVEVSPLDVQGIDLGLTAEEILTFIHEGRERGA